MNNWNRLKSFTLLASFLASSFIQAAESKPIRGHHTESMVVTDVSWVQPGKPFWVALRFEMDPHWHTYWLNPGDSGSVTTIKWHLPKGFEAGPIQWPYPVRMPVPPLLNYGYEGEVYLLTQITPSASLPVGTTQTLSAQADWLICKETCIPERATHSFQIAVKSEAPASDPTWAAPIKLTLGRLPKSLPKEYEFRVVDHSESLEVILSQKGPGRALPKGLQFFPKQDSWIENAVDPAVKVSSQQITLTFKRPAARPAQMSSKLDGVLVTGLADLPAVEVGTQVVVGPKKAFVNTAVPKASASEMLKMIFFALIGGLILNLMPCVFPIISIKILGFVSQAGGDKKKIRHHGLAFSAGVLISFWVLAASLVVVREAGMQLGWGFQLQSPLFLAFLATLFFILGMNLLGTFEIGTRLMGVGSGLKAQSELSQSFLTGVLATLVATPCTAPFMGAALGFALLHGALASFLIFSGLAIGMCVPYLLLSFYPSLISFLPRPGMWMETFKQLLSFPLFLTVIWLLWVFGLQTGMDGVIYLLCAFLVICFAVWLSRKGPKNFRTALIWLSILLAVALVYQGSNQQAVLSEARPTSGNDRANWKKFSRAAVDEARKTGAPVFIDFTAAWCVTCQVNKRVAFSSSEVKAQFEKKGVILFEADWTARDAVIAEELAKLNRSGVPVYVLYTPGAADSAAQLLPEILTPDILLSYLKTLPDREKAS
ncbi:thioredoxin family protein [bacterium]|jgi:thiol:disulfide interchange protein DsbD|nr:thioredoxin family protein [bacterium]